ncbi:ATP/GTP-binding protein [uncultured Gilvimarinus sp.]|uniref:GTP-binding protein n=1 Tax=uncultured Gilvimarinus sp. TaxID=1689143 RepID=UPI0030EB87ED|tara:strand:+ start:1065 stop:1574 length:510 start_codon:yes stop_codon:yes gene_type:complete
MQKKLLFAGPVGSGKTTAIAAISDSQPIGTEVPLSDGAMGDKTSTTVALDYSFVRLENEVLHIYGLPGQSSLSFMREILVPGALGVVLLLDATSGTLYEDALGWVQSMRAAESQLKFVVGVTKTDLPSDYSINKLRSTLAPYSGIPVLSVDARERASVKGLLETLMVLS